MTAIPHDLILAYKATEFRVFEPREFTLRIGQHSHELQTIYVELGVDCAGYLTAWNPLSKLVSSVENSTAQQQLHQKLTLQGFRPLPALGIDPSSKWPGEESVFVPGLGLDQAKLIGSEFGQNAIVWVGADAVPELVLLK